MLQLVQLTNYKQNRRFFKKTHSTLRYFLITEFRNHYTEQFRRIETLTNKSAVKVKRPGRHHLFCRTNAAMCETPLID